MSSSDKAVTADSGSAGISLERRRFIKKLGGGLVLGCAATVGGVSPASAGIFKNRFIFSGASHISFRNAHTGESFSGVYKVGNKYLHDSFRQINTVLRDFRTGDIYPIDPRLIDIIYTVHKMTGRSEPFEILSAYRSPHTNAMLRRTSSGVAKHSLHMKGQAIDLRLPGYSTKGIRAAALKLKAGGVGYYPKSNFVHLDTGEVRTW